MCVEFRTRRLFDGLRVPRRSPSRWRHRARPAAAARARAQVAPVRGAAGRAAPRRGPAAWRARSQSVIGHGFMERSACQIARPRRHSPLTYVVRGIAYSSTPARNSILRPMFSRETQALMEAAVDAIIVIDHRGRMSAVNDAASRMFGYPARRAAGRKRQHAHARTGPRRARRLPGALPRDRRRPRSSASAARSRAQRKDGSVFPVRLSVGRIANRARRASSGCCAT